jgi:hypothetical protein
MSEVVLNAEQARIIAEAGGPVVLRDPAGKLIAYTARRFSAEEIAEAERDLDSNQRLYTTQEVLAHLRSLEQR